MNKPWNMPMRGSRQDYLTAERFSRLGRGPDTEIGHLTPGEIVIPAGTLTPKLYAAIQEAGIDLGRFTVGAVRNSINPRTGQPEFYRPDESGVSSVSDPGRSTGGPGRESGGGSGGGSEPAVSTTGSSFPTSPEMGGSNPRRQQQQMVETVPQEDWAIDRDTGEFGQSGTMDAGGIMGGLGGFVLGGPAGAYAGYKVGTGRHDVDTFNAMPGHGPNANQGSPNVGREGGRETPLELGTPPLEPQQPVFMRPEILPTPQFLGLSSAMSPLQMRSAIASRAVAGQGGEYTSPEAQAYYDNLLRQALINEDGTLADLDSLLPIDLQYLAQVWGIENPADTAALLAALDDALAA